MHRMEKLRKLRHLPLCGYITESKRTVLPGTSEQNKREKMMIPKFPMTLLVSNTLQRKREEGPSFEATVVVVISFL